MKLIGMLDSPYVRRVAICLKLLKLDFGHRPVSVFRDFEEFRKLNPVVKAPTLILDDGQSLMDSTLILDYVTAIAGSAVTSIPDRADDRLRATRLTGLALAACDKTVQIVYERNLRPVEKQHEPWIDRVSVQLLAAYAELEAEVGLATLPLDAGRLGQAGVTVAVAWRFTQMMVPKIVVAAEYPNLQSFSAFAEQQPAFESTPPE
ncbi:glutathione S-transferase [Caballeronia sordidicola]|jgi:glutathione S-transferase|uniref:Glutathione S-transferase n=1 Tax=Caballeronia sordidicola TaxID=196367 RepID=A0A226WSE5_CABSO|nr:glutathione S-transferase [Caballeronia sordidicola]OXC73538.1 Glutathione S-transferase [Caballeronia sordidicola]